jgi:ribose transport system ATP-binding protein
MKESKTSPILEMKEITKRFPGVLALDNVNFTAHTGKIHSIIGQNGAGKSTLMKILAGDYAPTQGEILLNGNPVSFNNQRESRARGVSIVYQELSLLPNLSVADNIFLGREFRNHGLIDQKKIIRESHDVLVTLGVKNIDVNQKLGDLPLAQQQLVEIAKALSYDPQILILDEPTAALAPKDAEHLFRILLRLKEQKIAILYITHRLKEILALCDQGTILRNGTVVDTIEITPKTTEETLIELMIGQEMNSFYHFRSENNHNQEAEKVLEVRGLKVSDRVNHISFALKKGEILGITGLLGAGQNELARALFGIQSNIEGEIYRNGQKVNINSPQKAIKLGICLLTENRKEEGLFLDLSVKENISMPSLDRFIKSRFIPLIDNQREKTRVKTFIDKVNVILRSPETKMRTLSGGNQQKAILARWLLKDLEVLVFIEPTRGIDVGAKAEIYRYLEKLAQEGRGIIVISPELTEVMGVTNRILVMHEGKMVKEFKAEDATEERLLGAIQGATLKNDNHHHDKGKEK